MITITFDVTSDTMGPPPWRSYAPIVCIILMTAGVHDVQAVKIFVSEPTRGSLNGGTRITIHGEDFAENNFNLLPKDADLGNKVTFVSNLKTFECMIHADGTTKTQIMCDTPAMPYNYYRIHVSVNNAEATICGSCHFIPHYWHTPQIYSVSPTSGPPGTLITVCGRINSELYGPDMESPDGNSDIIRRVQAGGYTCEMKNETGELFHLALTDSRNGCFTCKLSPTNSRTGGVNVTFLVTGHFGLSMTYIQKIDRIGRPYMFQSYALIHSVSPTSGSTEGGTVLTINGEYFDDTLGRPTVKVGGKDCEVLTMSPTEITCRTPPNPDPPRSSYPGGRGLIHEVWNATYKNQDSLHEVSDFDESMDDHILTWSDDLYTYNDPRFAKVDLFTGRFKGLFTPQWDSEVVFLISCDDGAQLYLGLDGREENKTMIAECPRYTPHYDTYDEQMSAPMNLSSSQSYYIEVLYREGHYHYRAEVAVMFYNPVFTKTSGFRIDAIKREVQIIKMVSTFRKERQLIKLSNWPNPLKQSVHTIQTLVVSGSSGSYRLGMYSVYTRNILLGCDAEQIETELNYLPVLANGETMSVTLTNADTSNGIFTYQIKVNSDRGDFQALQVKKMSGTFTSTVTVTQTGSPNGETITLFLDGVPAPPVRSSGATKEEITDSLKTMISSRCPTFISNRKCFNSFDFETNKGLPALYNNEWTDQVEAYCGNGVLKNPHELFYDRYMTRVDLKRHGTVCMAYRGNISPRLTLYFRRKYQSGKESNTWMNIDDYFTPSTRWTYNCTDLWGYLSPRYNDIDTIFLRRMYASVSSADEGDFYVDTLCWGEAEKNDPLLQTDTDELRLSAMPNGYKLLDMEVENYLNGTFEVTFTAAPGGYGFPLMETKQGQLPAEAIVSVTQQEFASPPIGGTFDLFLPLGNLLLKDVPVNISDEDIERRLQEFKPSKLSVERKGDDLLFDFEFHVEYSTYEGNVLEQLEVNASMVTGRDINVTTATIQDGGYFMDPIPGDNLRMIYTTPQVEVTNSGMSANCSGNCSFEWLDSVTPVINESTPDSGPPNTTVTITGSGFNEASGNTVTIGGVECMVSTATDTSITCKTGLGPYGDYKVMVNVAGKGYAKHDTSAKTFKYNTRIESIDPSSSGLGGGAELSVHGYGFSDSVTISVGSKPCEVTSVTYTEVKCQVPLANTAGTVDVTIEYVTTNGTETDTLSSGFTYDDSLTPQVSSISPTVTGVGGGEIIVIDGTGFDAGDNVVLWLGDTRLEVSSHNDTQVTAELLPCATGAHDIRLSIGTKGAALKTDNTLPSLTCELRVDNVHPIRGSILGGTSITVSGSGFTDDVKVLVGEHVCKVDTVNDTQLTCRIQHTRKVHYITTTADHNADTPFLTIRAGDTVEFRWEYPDFSANKQSIKETTNWESTDLIPGGFSSGDATKYGVYRKNFYETREHFYTSGIINTQEKNFYNGKIKVLALTSTAAKVKVTVKDVEADYNTTSGVPNPADPNSCKSTTAKTSTCTDTYPSAPDNANFYFRFWKCTTPYLDGVSTDNGTSATDIELSGTGFSGKNCQNEISFGDYKCSAKTSSVTSVRCQIDTDNKPEVGHRSLIELRVNNKGYVAQMSNKEDTFVLYPLVTSVNPIIGSLAGGTLVTLTGTGFVDQEDEDCTESVKVTFGPFAYECVIQSCSYTSITCLSPWSVSATDVSVAVSINQVPAVCEPSCNFTYSTEYTPTVSSVEPAVITGSPTTLTINGTVLGTTQSSVEVSFSSTSAETSKYPCSLVAAPTDTELRCSISNLPVGQNKLHAYIDGKGMATGDVYITSDKTIDSINPDQGSMHGGTALTVNGNGFLPDTVVNVNNKNCEVVSTSLVSVVCTTPGETTEGPVSVRVSSNRINYPSQTFTYNASITPYIELVSPVQGLSGGTVTITGTNFGADIESNDVKIQESTCNVTSSTETQIECVAGSLSAGTYPLWVTVEGVGKSNDNQTFTYEMSASSISPNSGSMAGGQLVTVSGTGFDSNVHVTIDNQTCVIQNGSITPTEVVCKTPPVQGSDAVVSDVTLSLNSVVKNITNAYTYRPNLTPTITGVTPNRGGTAGGTTVTINGTNFGTQQNFPCASSVSIAGTECGIVSWSDTQIMCTSGAHIGSVMSAVTVVPNCNGEAKQEAAEYHYVDVWSSKFSWGGEDPPGYGDFVVIPQGQTIVLDTYTEILKFLLIQGGKLIFDDKDIQLNAETVLVTNGGLLQIGTEDMPYLYQGRINIYGDLSSLELPIYGAKTLAIRDSTLDIHGKERITHTVLEQTVEAGDDVIEVQGEVDWEVGDEIALGSTGSSDEYDQNESGRIKNINTTSHDTTRIQLEESLRYQHVGETLNLAGRQIETRGTVILLTRNIVIEGKKDPAKVNNVPACQDDTQTGEFQVNSCSTGRSHTEDQFGVHIIIHRSEAATNLTQARIEYVEVHNAGQAFRLGRYPLHFHLLRDYAALSYIRGASVHKSFNRAINIHNSHDSLIEDNVMYDIMGGVLFFEDGIEHGNMVRNNTIISIKASSSLLNDDVTPAGYWFLNPNNSFIQNSASGGSHIGAWLRTHEHPTGPSFTKSVCPTTLPLGTFKDNKFFAMGSFGFWQFPTYNPRSGSCSSSSANAIPAVFENFLVMGCKKGFESVNSGFVVAKGITAVNCKNAGIEFKLVTEGGDPLSPFGGASITDAFIVAPDKGTGDGIVMPYQTSSPSFSVTNSTFLNFNSNTGAAFAVTRIAGHCTERCGGFEYVTSNLSFINSTSLTKFEWSWEGIIRDIDGSLCGSKDCRVLPTVGTLPSEMCYDFEGDIGFPASYCTREMNFFRFAFNNLKPESLVFNAFNISTQGRTEIVYYQFKGITHPIGYHFNLLSNESTIIDFDWDKVTNLSFTGLISHVQPWGYSILGWHMTRKPDIFKINGEEINSTLNQREIDPEVDFHGDWRYDNMTGLLQVLVSHNERDEDLWLGYKNYLFNMEAIHCYYPDCIDPATQKPTGLLDSRPDTAKLWSNNDSWPEGVLPVANDNVTITEDDWIVLDTMPPVLEKVFLYGVLEFDHGPIDGAYRNLTLNVTDIIIIGGRLIIGWPDQPYLGEAAIVLRGQRLLNSRVEQYLPGTNIMVNRKTVANFGHVDFHGKEVRKPWTTLGATASPGDTTLTLSEEVPWVPGDTLILAPTSYDPWETETVSIKDISDDGLTVTLEGEISFRHIAHTEHVNGEPVIMAAEIGKVTRNIKIIGEDAPESFGGRVLVGQAVANGILYTGSARISNVQFYQSGQEGFMDSDDPRFSVAFVNIGDVTDEKPSYVKECAFFDGYSPAVGVFETHYLNITDNVIHHTVWDGMIIEGRYTRVIHNLVVLVIWDGAYDGRREVLNFRVGAGILGTEAYKMALYDNHVAGAERTGYRLQGIACGDGTERPSGNVAHSSSFGFLIFQNDKISPDIIQNECFEITGYSFYKIIYVAVYYQSKFSVIVSNFNVIESGLGMYLQILGPNVVDHQYKDKFANVTNGAFIGGTASFNYTTDMYPNNTNIELLKGRVSLPYSGPNVGLFPAGFMSAGNNAPTKPFVNNMAYNSIMGITWVSHVVFQNFGRRYNYDDFAITSDGKNEDGQHPIYMDNITLINTTEQHFVQYSRSSLTKINDGDCVDMACDGQLKLLIKDLDGSVLGTQGAIIPQSEFDWNNAKSRRNLGDHRVPVALLADEKGNIGPVNDTAPHKGIIRNPQCQYNDLWRAYKCHNLDYLMMIIESMDTDSETRRLSPVAILGDGYLDLINGPQDHGWCSGYTCRKRISTFMALIAADKTYLLYFTSTSPQKLRLFLLNSDNTQAVVIGIWYASSQRRVVYNSDNTLVPSNGMEDGRYLKPSKDFIPNPMSDAQSGSNYYDRENKLMYVLVRGGDNIIVDTLPTITLSFEVPDVSIDEFFGANLVNNLAAFFGISKEKIRIVDIVSENGSRRKRSSTSSVNIEISESPANTTSPLNSTANSTQPSEGSNGTLSFEALQDMTQEIATLAQLGDINEVLNTTIVGVAVVPPQPDPSSDEWSVQANYSDNTGEPERLVRLDGFFLYTQPEPSYESNIFPTQPKIQVLDAQGYPVTQLGASGQIWTVTAYLREDSNSTEPTQGFTYNPNATLQGATTIIFVDGWANFTDLGISQSGTKYVIDFNLTKPETDASLHIASQSLTVERRHIRPEITLVSSSLVENATVEINVELFDNSSNLLITDVFWRGHNWTITIELNEKADPLGTLTGTTQVNFDPVTNRAMFDDLTITGYGVYFLNFHIVSSPAEYEFNEEISVTVNASSPVDTSASRVMEITYDANYDDVITGNVTAEHFGTAVVNKYARENPQTRCKLVSVAKGSIIVTLTVTGSEAAVNSTVEFACMNNTSFMFDGMTVPLSGTPTFDGNTCSDLIPTTTTTTLTTTTPTTTTTTPTTTTTTPTTTTTIPTTTTTTPTTTTTTPTTTTTTPTTTTTTPTTTTTTPTTTTTTPTTTTTTPTTTTTTPTTTTTTPTTTTTTPTTTTTTPTTTTTTPTTTTTTPTTTTTTPTTTTTTPTTTTTTPTTTTTTPTTTTTTPTTTTTTSTTTTTTPTTTATPAFRPLRQKITVMSTSVVENAVLEIKTELFDNSTNALITDVFWKNHTWNVTIQLNTKVGPLGTLTGTTQVTFDPVTSKAMFDDLTITRYGVYFLNIHIVSSPAEYEFNEEISVIVTASSPVDTSASRVMETVFNVNYDDVIKGDVTAEHFGTAVMNRYACGNTGIICSLISVTRGNVIVKFNVTGSAAAVYSTLESACANTSSVLFNGMTVPLAGTPTFDGSSCSALIATTTPALPSRERMSTSILIIIIAAVLVIPVTAAVVFMCRRNTNRTGRNGQYLSDPYHENIDTIYTDKWGQMKEDTYVSRPASVLSYKNGGPSMRSETPSIYVQRSPMLDTRQIYTEPLTGSITASSFREPHSRTATPVVLGVSNGGYQSDRPIKAKLSSSTDGRSSPAYYTGNGNWR
ncbi:fibrocystin-L-like [Argopecten irradians]|uniref:fibrocystin-L-like n=1 Tax=Argopecten irradians TaxID=31199 RepID=UPI00371D4832